MYVSDHIRMAVQYATQPQRVVLRRAMILQRAVIQKIAKWKTIVPTIMHTNILLPWILYNIMK